MALAPNEIQNQSDLSAHLRTVQKMLNALLKIYLAIALHRRGQREAKNARLRQDA